MRPDSFVRDHSDQASWTTAAKGFILNCGPKLIHVHYSLEESGNPVGPETDYVQPGQFREIGAAKGVIWHVTEAD